MVKTSTSFKKGDPRINRKGAPKKEWTWRGLIMQAAEAADETGLPMKKIAAAALVAKAASGDVAALKEFGDRVDGKAVATIEQDITSNGERVEGFVLQFIGNAPPDDPVSK